MSRVGEGEEGKERGGEGRGGVREREIYSTKYSIQRENTITKS